MHYSVLKSEVIDGLNIKSGGIYVDATLGYAGDAKEILSRLDTGYLYAFDSDPKAIEYSDNVLKGLSSNYKLFNTNFINLVEILKNEEITGIDGIVFDLGFSSPQVDDPTRGFSFQNVGPLDMRMSSEGVTAKDIIDTYTEEELATIFYKFGEEKKSYVIAKKIKENVSSINTTLDLTETIKFAVGANYFYKHHPERKIFQALRIEVNHELDYLESVLPEVIEYLNPGGRICVITFHSLEDRIVKNIFKDLSSVPEILSGEINIPDEYKPKLKIINKKPILPSKKELQENTRSKSAKLRIGERI